MNENEYGRLYKKEDRFVLAFKRAYPFEAEAVYRVITDPQAFKEWYPFATGEMDLRVGGKIPFDDGEGSTYEAVITELEPPHSFSFQEVDDLLDIRIIETDKGSQLTFRHTFSDRDMAMYVAAGWHRCLDVLDQIIHGQEVEWKENAEELREYYRHSFCEQE